MVKQSEAVKSIYSDEDASFCLNTDQFDCPDSSFCDPHHKHIITGNLRIIKNSKLKKLLAKGPNYRELGTINFSKELIERTTALNKCITLKTKYVTSNFKPWKEAVLAKVKEKITELK